MKRDPNCSGKSTTPRTEQASGDPSLDRQRSHPPSLPDMKTQRLGSLIDVSQSSNESQPSNETEKKFDPYHFAITTMPKGLTAEIMARHLPSVPREQLFEMPADELEPSPTAPVSRESVPAVGSIPMSGEAEQVGTPHRSRGAAVAAGIVGCALVLSLIAVAFSRETHHSTDQRASSTQGEPRSEELGVTRELRTEPPPRTESSGVSTALTKPSNSMERLKVAPHQPSSTRPVSPTPKRNYVESPHAEAKQPTKTAPTPAASSARRNPLDVIPPLDGE